MKNLAKTCSKLLTLIVPAPLIVFPLTIEASTLTLPSILTFEFLKSPVKVEVPVKLIVSVPLNVKFEKSREELALTSTIIFPAPLTTLLPKVLSFMLKVTPEFILTVELSNFPVKVEFPVNLIVSVPLNC